MRPQGGCSRSAVCSTLPKWWNMVVVTVGQSDGSIANHPGQAPASPRARQRELSLLVARKKAVSTQGHPQIQLTAAGGLRLRALGTDQMAWKLASKAGCWIGHTD